MTGQRRGAPFGVRLPSGFWPLVDQGVVSVGGFVVNLALARTLAPQDYGTFSLLFMAMLQLQVVTASVLFYPLAVRGTLLGSEERAELFGTGLVLVLGLCVPLAVALAAGLAAAGHAGLALPAVAWLVLWQVQELLRRGLFAGLRHAAAIPGDAVRYLGQAAALVALALAGRLSLQSAVATMALLAGLGVAVQLRQCRLGLAGAGGWRPVLAACWRVGGGSLGSNLLGTMSLQLFPWSLALLGGAGLAAGFQASLNVVMVVNPVLIGLCNVVPQLVAREHRLHGARRAWRVSWRSMLAGAVPVLGFYALAAGWPRPLLAVLYGAHSPYLGLEGPVRLMAVAAAVGFGVEMVQAYLHGMQRTRLSMRINAAGLAVSVAAGLPLTLALGLGGSCIAIAGANLVRLAAAAAVLRRVLDGDREGPAEGAVVGGAVVGRAVAGGMAAGGAMPGGAVVGRAVAGGSMPGGAVRSGGGPDKAVAGRAAAAGRGDGRLSRT